MSAKKSIALGDDVVEIPAFLRSRAPAQVGSTGPEVITLGDLTTPEPMTESPADEPEPEALVEPSPEPSRELTDGREPDLAAMEADLKALCDEPLPVASIALAIQNEAAARARALQSDRQAIADRMQLIINRTDDVVAVYTAKLADYDRGIDKILNGIGTSNTEQTS